MNIAEEDVDASHGAPPRKKRRPALACEQCRRRKIKCDRRSPCQPCINANIEKCQYLRDTRNTLKTAPFKAQDTQFSVFEQTARPYTATTVSTSTTRPVTSDGLLSSNLSDSGSLVSFSEQDLSWTSILSPVSQPLEQDFDLTSMLSGHDHSAQPKVIPSANPYPGSGVDAVSSPLFKTRYYGQSHWTNYANQSIEVMTIIQAHERHESSHGYPTFGGCKAISKAIKSQEPVTSASNFPLRDLIPNRQVSNHLVQAYLRTFQTIFGIINVPSFRKSYQAFWDDSRPTDDTFGIILLLIMCIGSTFVSSETSVAKSSIRQWNHIASAWLTSSKQKAKLTLGGLRVQCLYLLACQTTSIKRDITSLSTGTLLQSAMQMGLHVDPEKKPVPGMCPSEVESRRRLWATLLELELQSSMDCGSLPLVDSDDYDCAISSNVDDASLDTAKSSGSIAQPRPIEQFTQSSFQILLARTTPARLKIAKFLNGFASSNSYETVIKLSTELSMVLASCYGLIDEYKMSSTPPTAFQTKLFDLLVQRFVLSLHHPFAIKATSNPSYFYSRKLCLSTSLALFSPSGEDFHRLLLFGSGFFRDVLTQATLYMCGELIDDREAAQTFPFNPVSTFACDEMRKATEKYQKLSVERMDLGDRSIKRFVLVSCLLAQADAVQSGPNRERKITNALMEALQTCHDKLMAQLRSMQGDKRHSSLNMTPVSAVDATQWEDLMGSNMVGRSP